jgi:hypothetical protein
MYVYMVFAPRALANNTNADSIDDAHGLQWRVGVEFASAFVPNTNLYVSGTNALGKEINSCLSGAIRADFSFNPNSKTGMLYRGVYQGIAVEKRTFFTHKLLGEPTSLYLYQGAPFARIGKRLSLGYEWRFGAAFGWRNKYAVEVNEYNNAISTSVTAHMGIALRLQYQLSDEWAASVGIDATHYSNGNTSFPNRGINSIGANVGVAYTLNPKHSVQTLDNEVAAEADRSRWMFDIIAYGAWRKRGIVFDDGGQICPGRFGIAGLQVQPLRKVNRWFAAGASLDLQYDESGSIKQYWVEGTYDNDIKFYHVPFNKRISVGTSAHAELTMPIFTLDVGMGYSFVHPNGDKSFYQSLTLKTFVTKHLFLNVGYRIGDFKDPQNLMLGIGVRL